MVNSVTEIELTTAVACILNRQLRNPVALSQVNRPIFYNTKRFSVRTGS